jgi:ubiquinone/menaquinone biosynthesis C-methylase UbiE
MFQSLTTNELLKNFVLEMLNPEYQGKKYLDLGCGKMRN